ncbi:MAG: hypothetical protein NTU53_13880 [Planctomycetota bacterium]|nr:hypothetical protein [Planctomycetota bacterium]
MAKRFFYTRQLQFKSKQPLVERGPTVPLLEQTPVRDDDKLVGDETSQCFAQIVRLKHGSVLSLQLSKAHSLPGLDVRNPIEDGHPNEGSNWRHLPQPQSLAHLSGSK